MAEFPRPTYSELVSRAQADLESRLPGTDAHLPRSVLNVLSYVIAGVTFGLYGFIDYLSRQIFPDTAEVEYLNRHGVIWGVERLQAVSAHGNVDFVGSDDVVIPANTQLQRSDLAIYLTKLDTTIASGVATVEVVADKPGENSNTPSGSTLTFISPIVDVDSLAIVATGGLYGGVDIEDDDSYLERILLKIQQPPQGGSAQDYILWAKECPGVTNVWVYPATPDPGYVTILFTMYNTYDDGIPLPIDVTNVQEHIDEKKPVTAIAVVSAPVSVPINFTIHIEINPGFVLASVQDDVEINLKDFIQRDASPSGTINYSRIVETVNATEGVFSSIVSVPSANVTTTGSDISTMGTVTWV